MSKPALMRAARILATLATMAGLAVCLLTTLGPGPANAATRGVASNAATTAWARAQTREIPSAQPAAAPDYYVGQALWVLYDQSPLRWCPSTSCGVIAYQS